MTTNYTIGKYYRLSSEDVDLKQSGKVESNSISNQRNLVESFIGKIPELAGAPAFEYLDDGWSGKNFERPDVQRLLADVRIGKINCIIVKDLSRFGRDYLTVGNYISRVFPFMQVRFIAINDGFDSIRPSDIDSLETSFKTLLYDLYSRDLSRKVRSARKYRAMRGDFISAFAPYGFIKDPANHSRLVPDPEAAQTVRNIFSWAAEGISTIKIAKRLNQAGVPTRMQYKRAAGCTRTLWPCVHEDNFWTDHHISTILRDERYLGKNVYGKRTRDIVGNAHTVMVKREEWVVVDDAYEGIVTQEEFDAAQKAMRDFVEFKGVPQNRPLLKKVRCGICGHVMTRSRAKTPAYYCRTPCVTDTYACPSESISESDILEMLADGLRRRACIAVEMKNLWTEKHRAKKAGAASIRNNLAILKDTLAKQKQNIKSLYEAFATGRLEKDDYLAAKAEASETANETIAEIGKLEAELASMGSEGDMQNRFVDTFQRYTSGEDITSEIIADVLDCVMVYPGGRFEIVWNYQSEFENLFTELYGGKENEA